LALVGNPEFIILDEPINGLDPQGIAEMRAIINRLSKELGMTVIVSSHILDELVKLADSFAIINGGKLLDEFSADELVERCSKYAFLKTSDSKKAQKSLSDMGIDGCVIVNEQSLRITSEIEDSSKIVAKLVGDGLGVYELSFKQMTLEEYYLDRTGRNE
jgi:ABC-2 type transport system ATP-binding protein